MHYSFGMLENVLIKFKKFIIPIEFVILDMEENVNMPLILGRPFLTIIGAIIDVKQRKLKF